MDTAQLGFWIRKLQWPRTQIVERTVIYVYGSLHSVRFPFLTKMGRLPFVSSLLLLLALPPPFPSARAANAARRERYMKNVWFICKTPSRQGEEESRPVIRHTPWTLIYQHFCFQVLRISNTQKHLESQAWKCQHGHRACYITDNPFEKSKSQFRVLAPVRVSESCRQAARYNQYGIKPSWNQTMTGTRFSA